MGLGNNQRCDLANKVDPMKAKITHFLLFDFTIKNQDEFQNFNFINKENFECQFKYKLIIKIYNINKCQN